MRLLGFGRRSDEPSESKLLAADLYAGGARADRAVKFLAEKLSEAFRPGGDHAVELFSDWLDILMEGNPDTARKFCARVLPMLPVETRKRVLAQHGIESDSTYGGLDPLIESLAAEIVIGGSDGAAAITKMFNAVEQVKGGDEAEAVVQELSSRLSPDIRSSMLPHLSERLRALVAR